MVRAIYCVLVLLRVDILMSVPKMGFASRAIRLIALVLAPLLPGANALLATDLENIRVGGSGQSTRVVFDLSAASTPRVFLLKSPARIVVDFTGLAGAKIPKVALKGIISGLRHGYFNEKTYRVVLDLKGLAVVERAFTLPAASGAKDRFVLDLVPTSEAGFRDAVDESKNRVPARPVTATPRRVARKRTSSKRLIVLDPGHGGVDPGTLGILGVNEKVIVLKVSRAIKEALEATGRYEVRLTRTRDIYIPHRQRYGIAHDAGADLFISVHADSIADPNVRGGTVYTLSEKASDREAARIAAKENKSDVIAGLDLRETDNVVSGILIDLAQRETLNESVAFAQLLVPSMRRQVKMHKRGHRFANLLVLKSIDVPSILLETGYLTNRVDARMLNSRAGQRKIARGVLEAVDRYFARQTALVLD